MRRLTYLNNRYYDPATGAFTSVDPLVGQTGTPYLYANGNPTTLSDPTGLCVFLAGADTAVCVEVAAGLLALVGLTIALPKLDLRLPGWDDLFGGVDFGDSLAPVAAAYGRVQQRAQALASAVVNGDLTQEQANALAPALLDVDAELNDDDSDPLGLEELTGWDPESIVGAIEAHSAEKHPLTAAQVDAITRGLRNPDAHVGPNVGETGDLGISIRIPGTKITVLVNAERPGQSTAIIESTPKFHERYR